MLAQDEPNSSYEFMIQIVHELFSHDSFSIKILYPTTNYEFTKNIPVPYIFIIIY